MSELAEDESPAVEVTSRMAQYYAFSLDHILYNDFTQKSGQGNLYIISCLGFIVISGYNDSVLMPPPAVLPSHISIDDRKFSWKLNTPLAAMLPSKYAHLDVTDLFPEFRPNKVTHLFTNVN